MLTAIAGFFKNVFQCISGPDSTDLKTLKKRTEEFTTYCTQKGIVRDPKKKAFEYYDRLQLLVEFYIRVNDRPNVSDLKLPKTATSDFRVLRDIAEKSSSQKKLQKMCQEALALKFPKSVLQRHVGKHFDLDQLDDEKARHEKLDRLVAQVDRPCSICRNDLTVSHLYFKKVYSTPCEKAHFVCTTCVRAWRSHTGGTRLKCPECRFVFDDNVHAPKWEKYLAANEVLLREKLGEKVKPKADIDASASPCAGCHKPYTKADVAANNILMAPCEHHFHQQCELGTTRSGTRKIEGALLCPCCSKAVTVKQGQEGFQTYMKQVQKAALQAIVVEPEDETVTEQEKEQMQQRNLQEQREARQEQIEADERYARILAG